MNFNSAKLQLAIKLRHARAFKVRSESEDGLGFILKKHRDHPELNLPRSPYYLNLRPEPGPLDDNLINAIAKVFYSLTQAYKLKFTHVCGIPNAAISYAEELAKITNKSRIQLKKLSDGSYGDFAANWMPGQSSALVIDDVVTTSSSKLPAIEILTKSKFSISAILVLVDREEGGLESLKKAGYRVEAAFTTSELTELIAIQGGITTKEKKDILSYVQDIKNSSAQ